jgi:hypothetical protein
MQKHAAWPEAHKLKHEMISGFYCEANKFVIYLTNTYYSTTANTAENNSISPGSINKQRLGVLTLDWFSINYFSALFSSLTSVTHCYELLYIRSSFI